MASVDLNNIEGDSSTQSQTMWVACHSRSRTYSESSRAERRQSMVAMFSPVT
jgi:hypothetical protein